MGVRERIRMRRKNDKNSYEFRGLVIQKQINKLEKIRNVYTQLIK
jgi:hypothetical protein